MSIPSQITFQDLPSKVKITLPEEPETTGTSAIEFIGLGIAIIGVLFILFGPNEIVYNRYEGMSFVQMLQAYPGPIASVGFLIYGLTNRMRVSGLEEYQVQVLETLEAAILIKDEEIPEGYRLSIDTEAGDEKGVYLVSLVEASDEDEETSQESKMDTTQPDEEASGKHNESTAKF
ncbi:hypothetical protein KDD30_22485 (plasmid) [Photobacterium sp. GJ3]|uniref:hypothetical protein n=1 Tax=Photobacterium sp. GJ3 TaxID=2829502 RepID=UPI001B8D0F48|nr:hypothetical protein [Photobacterium sp. GJ3]QUJ69518.1 hypothetical protein KDD30_22485 [Photobacterium sp. GJ3]